MPRKATIPLRQLRKLKRIRAKVAKLYEETEAVEAAILTKAPAGAMAEVDGELWEIVDKFADPLSKYWKSTPISRFEIKPVTRKRAAELRNAEAVKHGAAGAATETDGGKESAGESGSA